MVKCSKKHKKEKKEKEKRNNNHISHQITKHKIITCYGQALNSGDLILQHLKHVDWCNGIHCALAVFCFN